MKKLVLLLISLFMLNAVSGIASDLKNNYERGETAIGKLSGEILEQINPSQVKLKRNNVNIAFEYDVKKLGSDYYVWFIVPQTAANYTLVIEDIITRINGVVQSADYAKEFSVSGNLTDYSITPGFIFASENFEVNALLNEELSTSINVDFPEAREIVLRPGNNQIAFDIGGVEETALYLIAIGKYNFPAYIIGQNLSSGGQNNSQNVSMNQSVVNNSMNISNGENQSNVNASEINNSALVFPPRFEFSSSVIKGELPLTGELPVFTFDVINKGEDVLVPRFNYNKNRFDIFPDEGIIIEPGGSFPFNLTLKDFERESFREAVIVFSGNVSDYFLVLMNFTDAEKVSVDYLNKAEGQSYFYCSELSGKICSSEESCSENEVESLDGSCCLAGCEIGAGKSYAWIGYLIAGIILLVLSLIYLKYRKTKQADGGEIKKRFALAESNLPYNAGHK